MANENEDLEQTGSKSTSRFDRRYLLSFGSLLSVVSGASYMSLLGAKNAHAAPNDKTPPPNTYVPIAEKGSPSGVATLDADAKVSQTQLPDFTAIYAKLPEGKQNALTGWWHVDGFGAKLDGVANDAPALNAARAAAAAAGGGTVFIPSGVVGIGSPVELASRVDIKGNGMTETILQALPSCDVAVLLGRSTATVSNIQVSDLSIDAGYSVTKKVIAASQITNGSRPIFKNVTVHNAGGVGLLFQGLGIGGGTPNVTVEDCYIDGTGLADGTTGMGIWVKDASSYAKIRNNTIQNVKGGMGIGLGGGADTGFPTHNIISHNIISMTESATGFEPIGITSGCAYTDISHNRVYNSFDNGISVSADFCTVIGNNIDGAFNHGIASAGNDTVIIGNSIRNVGKENPGLGFAFICTDSAARNLIALNKGMDDQSAKSTTYGVKLNISGGSNVICANSWTGQSGPEVTGNLASDICISLLADGLQTRRLAADVIQEKTSNSGIAFSSTCGFNSLVFSGSGRLGSGQHVFSSNLPASRPATYHYSVYNQAADITQWATTNMDATTQTVRAGVTSSGQLYSSEGIRTKDLGAIDGKSSAQIDALFLTRPSDGTVAVGSISGTSIFLNRRNGKWNYSTAIAIS
ncbi:glycosyl hydrolase family 28-related protein [Pseudarthrobacter sp. NPDC089323]